MRNTVFSRLAGISAVWALLLSANAEAQSAYADLNDSDVVKALKSHVAYIASDRMQGRKAGSAGEKVVADYVRDIFNESGVELLSGEEGDVFGISKEGGDTLTSRNVMGFIQGFDPELNDRYIVVGARMDNLGTNVLEVDGKPQTQIYYGANGNASGLSLMLELSKMAATNAIQFRRSVIFIAFGASCESFAGSWYFLNRSFSDVANIDAMIDLDMLGTGSRGFYAYTSSNADMNMILSQVAETLQPVLPIVTSEEPYPSDNRAFYSKEIPSVLFTTGRYPEYNTPKDTPDIVQYDALERELEYIYNFTLYLSNLDNPPLFDADKVAVKTDNRLYSYYDCDVRPLFMGSADPKSFLLKWIYQYLKYPKAAVENGIQGRVIVDFVIDNEGNVDDVRVARSADPLLDAEAIRVVKASPRWKPGLVKGSPVSTSMSVAVDFMLTRKGKFGIKK